MKIRRGSSGDVEACHGVMWASVTDFASRRGMPLEGSVAEWWASGEAMQRFLAARDALRGRVPLVVPLTLFGHHIRRRRVPYLAAQIYLRPHPLELTLRNHI